MFDKLGFVPDINRLISALDGKEPDRVPNFEFYVAQNIRSALLGYQCPDGIAGEVEFKPKFGYDFLYALGSSNSVADYVNPENYKAMLMANWEYGKIN